MSTPEQKIEKLGAAIGGRRGPELLIGDEPVCDVARRVGTPFYSYNGNSIATRIGDVRRALGPETGLVFCSGVLN